MPLRVPEVARGWSLVHLPVLANQTNADHVHQEREDEEQRAHREDGFVDRRPVEMSPPAVCAMNAVIVWWNSSGLRLMLGWPPPAMATIMVSPMAREIPRMKAAEMPDRAAGTTTRVDT